MVQRLKYGIRKKSLLKSAGLERFFLERSLWLYRMRSQQLLFNFSSPIFGYLRLTRNIRYNIDQKFHNTSQTYLCVTWIPFNAHQSTNIVIGRPCTSTRRFVQHNICLATGIPLPSGNWNRYNITNNMRWHLTSSLTLIPKSFNGSSVKLLSDSFSGSWSTLLLCFRLTESTEWHISSSNGTFTERLISTQTNFFFSASFFIMLLVTRLFWFKISWRYIDLSPTFSFFKPQYENEGHEQC